MAITKTTVVDPKGYSDKSSDTTFNKFVVTDGNTNHKVDNAINVMTKTMQIATDAQKDAYRIAQLKTSEGYSTSQPRIDAILPYFLLGDNKTITLVGINLFLNTASTVAKIETIDSTTMLPVETVSNVVVHQFMPSRLQFEIDRSLYVKDRDYYVRVTHNGLVSNVNTNAIFNIPTDQVSEPVVANWSILTEKPSEVYQVNSSDNSFNVKTIYKAGLTLENRSKWINILSDLEFKKDKNYILNIIIDGDSPNNPRNDNNLTYTMSFDLVNKEFYPTTNALSSVSGVKIFSGGDTKGAYYAPSCRLTDGLDMSLRGLKHITLLIGGGIFKLLYEDKVLTYLLPNSSLGIYKLFIAFNSSVFYNNNIVENNVDTSLNFTVDFFEEK